MPFDHHASICCTDAPRADNTYRLAPEKLSKEKGGEPAFIVSWLFGGRRLCMGKIYIHVSGNSGKEL
jgi:hypothetical protein